MNENERSRTMESVYFGKISPFINNKLIFLIFDGVTDLKAVSALINYNYRGSTLDSD